MKTLKNTVIKSLMILAVLMTSCTPEDGVDGQNGADGQQGEAGQDGNANVIASDWIASDFSTTPSSHAGFDVVDININEENVNGAAILSYGKYLGTDVVIQIPFVSFNYSYSTALLPGHNIIRFVGTTTDGASVLFTSISHVRYVIIPPGGRSAGGREAILNDLRNKGVDVNDFASVASHFGLSN